MPTSYRLGASQSIPTSTCCCTGTGTGTTGGCDCECCPEGYWTEYQISVSGVEPLPGAGCEPAPDQCTTYNGIFTLTRTSNCTWDSGDFFVHDCGGNPTVGGPTWVLSCVAGVWGLRPEYNPLGYESTDFNCIDGGTFDLGTPAGVEDCQGWPATITAVPSGVFVAC